MTVLRVALAGVGNVGAAVTRLLLQNKDLVTRRMDDRIDLLAVSARDPHKKRDCDLSGLRWFDNPLDMTLLPDIDVVVELIGGADGLALQLAEATLRNGKDLVTANKALIAKHGLRLVRLAETEGRQILFEAAVCGGIPVLKTLRESLTGNRIIQMRGILNGTCNFILSRMMRDNLTFEAALAEAQKKGYAEADPSADVDGHDTAHKLAILSALAYGCAPDLSHMTVAGIRGIEPLDIGAADALGYRIKLLGHAQMTSRGLAQRVGPCLVSKTWSLASVEQEQNALVIEGDFVGRLMLTGLGAGGGATASAVVSDLADLACGTRRLPFSAPSINLTPAPVDDSGKVRAAYIRLRVVDKPGVLADVSAILRDFDISIESMLQKGRSETKVPVIMTTHATTETALQSALDLIAGCSAIAEKPFWLRIEAD